MTQKVGIRQIAKLAGVSIGTVSKAFNPESKAGIYMSSETRQRIFEVARKFNYTPNYGATLLRQKSSRTIGFAAALPSENLATPLSGYTLRILNGLLPAAAAEGYQILQLTGQDYSRYLDTRRIDALAFVGFRPNDNPRRLEMIGMFEHLNRNRYPYVVFNNTCEELELPSIRLDNRYGMKLIADHLIERQFPTVGFVGELQDDPSTTSILRLAYLREFLAGSPVRLAEEACLNGPGPWGTEPREGLHCHRDGRRAVAFLAENKRLPRILVCSNDEFAEGVVRGAADFGIRIPEDLAIIGFDGKPTAEYLVPTLTTVEQPLEEFGRQAFAYLMRRMEDPDYMEDIVIKPTLLVRESSRHDV